MCLIRSINDDTALRACSEKPSVASQDKTMLTCKVCFVILSEAKNLYRFCNEKAPQGRYFRGRNEWTRTTDPHLIRVVL